MKAVAAAASGVLSCADIVLLHTLTVHVPHEVHSLLMQAKTSHLMPARLLSYQHVLLALSHVTLARCATLNPATLLPAPDDGDTHDCCDIVSMCTKPRPDISETPFTNPDLVFYVGGSSMRLGSGEEGSGYAVVNQFEVVEAHSLPGNYSAQAAELVPPV